MYVGERLIHISHPRYRMNDEANKKTGEKKRFNEKKRRMRTIVCLLLNDDTHPTQDTQMKVTPSEVS